MRSACYYRRFRRLPLAAYTTICLCASILICKFFILRNIEGSRIKFTKDDPPKMINLTVDFMLEPPIESNDHNIQVLVMVVTHPKEYRTRQEIRNSWGNNSEYDNRTTKVLFLMGRPTSTSELASILIESNNYKDLVVAEMDEGYKETKCLVKADSDNVLMLYNYERLCEENKAPLILGKCNIQKRVLRTISKWAVPEYVYSANEYPPYCSTGTYVFLGRDLPRKLLVAAANSLFTTSSNFRMLPEDVIWTGILAENAKISRKHVGAMSFVDAPEYRCRDGYKHIYSIHMNRVKSPITYYKKLSNFEATPCYWYKFFNILLGLFLLFLIICAIVQQSIYNKKTRIFKESLDEALRLGIVRRIDRSEMESSHEQPPIFTTGTSASP
ncbi:hypothetical protein WR25_24475 [Diploscapter pachys]|uniref:Hexosyltransferase n=1 Tax=Diploscapter pachys TaxID=2018661 RepID=A0A2A2KXT6_9BILA|nr:hypothetical protein WR25_24475 [Diploscapter pachys]